MIGGTLKSSHLKEKYHCMAVGFEADDGTIDTLARWRGAKPEKS